VNERHVAPERREHAGADGLAQAQISVTRLGLGDTDRASFKVEFRRSGDEWRVSRADRLASP